VPKHPIRGARQSPYAASRTNFRGFSHEIHSIYEAKPYLVGWTLRSPDRDSVLIGAGTSGLGRLQDHCQLTASPNLATPDTMRSCLLHVQRPKTGGFFGEGLQCHWSPASAVRVSSARSFHWTAGYRPNCKRYGANDGRSGVEYAMMPMTNEVLAMGMRFRRLGHGEQQVCGAIAVERVSGTCGRDTTTPGGAVAVVPAERRTPRGIT
jgi:hypothetical protein